MASMVYRVGIATGDSLSSYLGRLTGLLPRLPSIQIKVRLPGSSNNNNNNNSELENGKSKLEELVEKLKNQDVGSIFNPMEMGILRAVPKKKVTHCRKRKRQMDTSKQYKLKLNLNCCPSCGRVKKSHFICHHCALEIRNFWRKLDSTENAHLEEQKNFANQEFLSDLDKRILYPGKFLGFEARKLKDVDSWVLKRNKPIFFEKNMITRNKNDILRDALEKDKQDKQGKA